MENEYLEWIEVQQYDVDLSFIKKKRLELGYTHGELAYYLGYKNPCSYYKYEHGDYTFKAIHLPILAQVLKCDLDSLFKKK